MKVFALFFIFLLTMTSVAEVSASSKTSLDQAIETIINSVGGQAISFQSQSSNNVFVDLPGNPNFYLPNASMADALNKICDLKKHWAPAGERTMYCIVKTKTTP